MTELETLRNALRDDAERHYGRRGRLLSRLLVPGLAIGLALAVIVFVVLDLGRDQPRDEVAATPTPTAATVFTATPAPTVEQQERPPVELRHNPPPAGADGPLRLAGVDPIAPDDPTLDGLLGEGAQIVQAWSVPKLKGHVILSRRGTDWCLSAPDPATNEPDIERGSTCGATEAIELGIGSTNVIYVPDTIKAPELTGDDGKVVTLQPREGLVVLLSRPRGSMLTTRP